MCYSGLLILGVRVQPFGRVSSIFTLTVAKTEKSSAKDSGLFGIPFQKGYKSQKWTQAPGLLMLSLSTVVMLEQGVCIHGGDPSGVSRAPFEESGVGYIVRINQFWPMFLDFESQLVIVRQGCHFDMTPSTCAPLQRSYVSEEFYFECLDFDRPYVCCLDF